MDNELEGFLQCCRDGKRPIADVAVVGLYDSIAVMFSNSCAGSGTPGELQRNREDGSARREKGLTTNSKEGESKWISI